MLKKIIAAISIMTLLWLGIWVMLITGINEIIEACNQKPINHTKIIFAIIKILLFEIPVIIAVAIVPWPLETSEIEEYDTEYDTEEY